MNDGDKVKLLISWKSVVRLNKAKELLVSRKYSIGEVANMVGFSDPKYFSTCFKKQFGTSPSKI